MRFNLSAFILVLVTIGHAFGIYAMTQLSQKTTPPKKEETIIQAIVLPPPVIEKPKEPEKEPPKPKKKQVVKKPKPQLPPPPAPVVANEQSIETPQAPLIPADVETSDEGGEYEPVITPPAVDKKHPNKSPPYPKQSRKDREEGTVILELLVNEKGTITQVRLKQSSGFKRLDKAALTSAKRWRYKPAMSEGKPISYWHTQPVKFLMN